MNRKQLFVLLIVGLVLGGLGYYLFRSGRAEFVSADAGTGQKLLGDFAANDVAALTVRSADGEVNLVRDGVWVVQERSRYPASFPKVAELVRKLWDLKPVQIHNVATSQWGRLELLPPGDPAAGTNAATVVELKDKEGKTLKTVRLGKRQMRDSGDPFGGFPVGRWVALPDQPARVYVVNETFSDINADPKEWLAKDSFFKVEKLKSISLVSTQPADSWAVSRTNDVSGAPWTLEDPREEETLDAGKVSSFNWALSSPTFNDVRPADSDEVKEAMAQPTELKLETFDGFQYVIRVGNAPDENNHLLTVDVTANLPSSRTAPEGETAEEKEARDKEWNEAQEKLKTKLKQEQSLRGWVFTVSKWSVDSLLKKRGDLIAAAPSQPDEAAADGDGDAPDAEDASQSADATESADAPDAPPDLEPPPLPEGLGAPGE